jgi:hypothetical protein
VLFVFQPVGRGLADRRPVLRNGRATWHSGEEFAGEWLLRLPAARLRARPWEDSLAVRCYKPAGLARMLGCL